MELVNNTVIIDHKPILAELERRLKQVALECVDTSKDLTELTESMRRLRAEIEITKKIGDYQVYPMRLYYQDIAEQTDRLVAARGKR